MMLPLASLLRLALRNWTLSLAVVLLVALLVPVGCPDDPFEMVGPALQWPGTWPGAPPGTDSLGRDIAAVIFDGARISLMVGLPVGALPAITAGGWATC